MTEKMIKIPLFGLTIATCLMLGSAVSQSNQKDLVVVNKSGMQLMVVEENTSPTLRVVLPGQPSTDRSIEIIFPEHVTVREHGSSDAYQLYMFQFGRTGEPPLWRRTERAL